MHIRTRFSLFVSCSVLLAIAGCGDAPMGADSGPEIDARVTPMPDAQGDAPTATCGDGAIALLETCDDGNTAAGDGCSDTCATETGFTCTGTPSVCTTTCGDGTPAGDEGCDDGNATPGDGCDATCEVETGFSCTGTPSVCTTGCGDGIVAGSEGCDDSNTADGDGCSGACVEESGYTCTGSPSVCATTCGDGVIAGTEQCDDAGTTAGDGCDAACAMEAGWACTAEPSTCTSVCGDGMLVGAEGCDDGNTAAGDGCDAACAMESGFTCSGIPSTCSTTCGDSIVAGAEGCDDGGTTGGDGCDAMCAVETGWVCAGTTCTPICGDGVLRGAEACDDGNAMTGDGCTPMCMVEAGWSCPGGACAPICGDGTIVGTEACDDMGTTAGDGCSATCTVETGFTCAGTPSTCATTCGDGIPAGMEACDDAPPAEAGDGCSATCTVETGWACTGAPSTCATTCGDGIRAGAEVCDDANTANGDGCTSTCTLEPGYVNEIEPNEDGTPSTGGSGIVGNDFSIANANGPFLRTGGEIRILAAVTPAGDEDVFAITNDGTTGVDVRVDTWNRAAGFGLGVSCGSSIDTGIHIRDAAGASVGSNDDRVSGSDFCSGLQFSLLPGQTRYVHVVEFGDNAIIPRYLLQVRFIPVVCGDGTRGAGETCDDGNTTAGDGCSAVCAVEPGYTCTTAMPNVCTPICGNGIITSPETCDDMNTTNGDGCTSTCRVEAGFVCSGAPSTCTAMHVCGDGTRSGTEQCDDGGTLPGDGCSATCTVEFVTEVEPNGTFAEADASTVIVAGDVAIQGAITPVADQDTYRIVVATSGVVRFETLTSFYDCSATIDLRLFDSAGVQIVADTSGAQGIGGCGAIVMPLAAGVYYVRVEERGNNATIASYFLEIDFQSDRGTETEPNETIATASVNLATFNDVWVSGDHTMDADTDVYSIIVPAGRRIRAEIVEGDRAVETCESLGIDSRLTLFDSAGAQLSDDDDDGRGFCSLLDGTGTTPLDSGARNLTAATQTFYLMVRRSGAITTIPDPDAQFIYRLQVSLR
jgi:cysteine-rich repeat protein